MGYEHVRVDRRKESVTLTIDRAPGNVLDLDLMDEINQALLDLRGDADLEVLVIRGANETFCEGVEMRDHHRERVQRMLQVYSRIFETIRMIDLVSIAAISGKAWGGGFELALGCNLIVATEDASFSLPEIKWGLYPPIASIILPRVVPRRRAMEWILTGCEVPASELHHFGLINRLFQARTFDEQLEAFVRDLTGKSGPVLQLAKQAQYEAYYSTYEEALYKVQNMYLRDLMELRDAREGIEAYLEDREPTWQNR